MSARAVGWVFEHSPYDNASLVVHLAIADVVNDTYGNEFWMGFRKLAQKAHTSERTVRRTIEMMINDGYLELVTEDRPRNVATYRFVEQTSDKLSPVTNGTGSVTNGAKSRSDTALTELNKPKRNSEIEIDEKPAINPKLDPEVIERGRKALAELRQR